MRSTVALANETWEALFRAQATIARDLADSEVWGDLQTSEYGVLYALTRSPGGKRITELAGDVLLTQPGLSRLVTRLESRGLITRCRDGGDGRAVVVTLTEEGRAVQRRVGAAHAREVSRAMRRALTGDEMAALRTLCRSITDTDDAR